MSYLQYDTEKMIEVKQAYVNAVSKMEDIKSKMQKMVDDVKEGWDTEAGDWSHCHTRDYNTRDGWRLSADYDCFYPVCKCVFLISSFWFLFQI